jgi:hypothetical protein
MSTTEQERERLRRLAEQEYKLRLQAIDWVLENASVNGASSPASKATNKAMRATVTPSLPVAVKEVSSQIEGDFDRTRLTAEIKAAYPGFGKIAPNYLRVLLSNLVKGKKLKITLAGGGKRQTRYTYIGG